MLFWTLHLELIVCFFRTLYHKLLVLVWTGNPCKLILCFFRTLKHRLLRCFSEPWRLIVRFFWTLNLTHHVFVRTLNSKLIMCFFRAFNPKFIIYHHVFSSNPNLGSGFEVKEFRVFPIAISSVTLQQLYEPYPCTMYRTPSTKTYICFLLYYESKLFYNLAEHSHLNITFSLAGRYIFYLKKRWPAKHFCCKPPWNPRKIFDHYIIWGFTTPK